LNPLSHWDAIDKVPDNTLPGDKKVLRVAILGIPNSGKSTLINNLVRHQVCPHSRKVHTTRNTARAVLTQEETQVVFLDTPGLVDQDTANKFKLEESLVKDPEKSCRGADVLLVLHDLSNRYSRESLDKQVLRLLCLHPRVPALLVLNKLDTIPRSRRIFDLIRKLTCNRLEGHKSQVKIQKYDGRKTVESYFKRKQRAAEFEEEIKEDVDKNPDEILTIVKTERLSESRVNSLTSGILGWPGFHDVFTISALHGDGVEDLRNYLVDLARPGQWHYQDHVLTDSDPRDLVLNTIKATLLNHLPHSVPYQLRPEIEVWDLDNDWESLKIVVSISSPNSNISRLLLGAKGSRIQTIAADAQNSLRDFFSSEVNLRINIVQNYEVKKNLPPPSATKKSDLFL